MHIESGKTYIDRVRVTSDDPDILSVKLRLGMLLSTLRLHPARLPPSAIICVRRLGDPLPGSLRLGGIAVHPPPAWEQAVMTSLDHLVTLAARPALGPVPPGAPAVLFADRAELLACLGSDWMAGAIRARWWWHALLRAEVLERPVPAAWIEAPQYIPAALVHLAASRRAVGFARALSAADARALVRAVARAFVLPDLVGVLEAARGAAGRAVQAPPGPDATGASVANVSQAPWAALMPQTDLGDLHLEGQLLLGLGLMLQRAPSAVRAPSFASVVEQWWRARRDSPRFRAAATAAPPARLARPRRELHRTDDTLGEAPAGSSGPADASRRDRRWTTFGHPTARRLPSRSELPVVERAGQSGSASVDAHELQDDAEERAAPLPTALPMRGHAVVPTLSPDRPSQRPQSGEAPGNADETPLYDAQIETALGGVFYLINLALFLDLYHDFMYPSERGIGLAIWDFLALMGEQLVEASSRSDPIWSLLASLAGRDEHAPPGGEWEPPDRWELPSAWLAPFAAGGAWRWSTAEDRLRVQHPEQFLVLDLPLEPGDPRPQLRRATAPYASHGVFQLEQASLPTATDGETPLARWIGWLAPYVRARLRLALGAEHDEDVGRIVCAHRALVLVTATHLDVVLSLSELPIAIRLAGLDRDPGWVPAAGRFVKFHFE